jgi:hypothetical protein
MPFLLHLNGDFVVVQKYCFFPFCLNILAFFCQQKSIIREENLRSFSLMLAGMLMITFITFLRKYYKEIFYGFPLKFEFTLCCCPWQRSVPRYFWAKKYQYPKGARGGGGIWVSDQNIEPCRKFNLTVTVSSY